MKGTTWLGVRMRSAAALPRTQQAHGSREPPIAGPGISSSTSLTSQSACARPLMGECAPEGGDVSAR